MPPDARKPLMALRGNGEPGDQDVLYGSITAVPAGAGDDRRAAGEVPVHADAAAGRRRQPTPQALAAVGELQKTPRRVKARWNALR